MSNKLFATIAVILVLALIVGGSIILLAGGRKSSTSGTSTSKTNPSDKVTLTIWRTFDDNTAFSQAIDAYQADHPNVTIQYQKKDLADYEVQSLNALAAGTGPDIWSIDANWMARHVNKLLPLPDDFFKNAKTKEDRSNEQYYNATWAPVTAGVNVIDHKVYGLPLYLDTLALYINNDLWGAARNQYRQDHANDNNFDDALFRHPPATWNELLDELPYLTKKDSSGTITQAGVALGTSNNITNSADMLSLLMLQNGTKMVDTGQKSARFNTFQNDASGKPVYNGTNALDFYTSFARADKSNYSWNSTEPDSVQAFVDGKVAIIIGYQYLTQSLKQRAPTLDFDTAPMPQVKGGQPVNYASFWTETVTNNSRHADVAWDFLASLALRPITYLQVTKRSSALLTDIQTNSSDVFPSQSLTAQMWPKGKSSDEVDGIFNQMIDNVVNKKQPLQSTIDAAASSVSSLLQKD